MRWRVGVAVLLALAVGVAGGWAYATSQDDDDPDGGPVAAAIQPVPATPSLPVVVAQPDPDDPTLETGIDLESATLQIPAEGDPSYEIELAVPTGWRRTFDGDNKYVYTVPGNDPKAYGLRIQIIAPLGRSIPAALAARIAGLQSAQAQGNISDVEYTVNQTDDGFDATYTDQQGYDRVSIERFYGGADGNAFATVAAYGRFRDRTGLEDLVARITEQGLVTSAPAQNP